MGGLLCSCLPSSMGQSKVASSRYHAGCIVIKACAPPNRLCSTRNGTMIPIDHIVRICSQRIVMGCWPAVLMRFSVAGIMVFLSTVTVLGRSICVRPQWQPGAGRSTNSASSCSFERLPDDLAQFLTSCRTNAPMLLAPLMLRGKVISRLTAHACFVADPSSVLEGSANE